MFKRCVKERRKKDELQRLCWLRKAISLIELNRGDQGNLGSIPCARTLTMLSRRQGNRAHTLHDTPHPYPSSRHPNTHAQHRPVHANLVATLSPSELGRACACATVAERNRAQSESGVEEEGKGRGLTQSLIRGLRGRSGGRLGRGVERKTWHRYDIWPGYMVAGKEKRPR